MGTLAITATGCKRLKGGTEAAKILLARQNLGESAVDTSVGIWDMMSDTVGKATKTKSNKMISSNSTIEFDANESRQISGDQAQEMTFKDGGNYYEFSNFPISSSIKETFNPFVESVENFAFDTAKTIGRIKNKIGVVDKWIKGIGEYQYMLSVKGETEYLYKRDTKGDNYSIAKRYTTQDAKSVYESVGFYTYTQNGEIAYGKTKDLYIAGERYESYYDHSSGFRDYVIVENSRGYWSLMRFYSWAEEKSVAFDVCIIKDGVGYCIFLQSDEDNGYQVAWVDIFDPVSGNDYMRVKEYGHSWFFEVSLSAITSGLKGIRAYGETMNELEEYGDSYRIYGDRIPLHVVTEKGEIAPETTFDNVTYKEGLIDYNTYNRFHSGHIEFEVDKTEQGETVESGVEKLLNFLSHYGMQTCFDGESIAKGVDLATVYSEEFPNIYSWNGHALTNYYGYEKGKQVLFNEYQNAIDEYARVKDVEVIRSRQKLANNVDFAKFSEFSLGQATYTNGKINLQNATAKITDTKLLEVGLNYKLKIGLTKVDKEGKFSSVNTVSLSGGNAQEVEFLGEEITLQGAGEYAVSKNLSEGDYMVVAYASTTDDIRVSEMKPLAFLTIEEGAIESTAMEITAKKSNENLIISYAVKLTYDMGIVEGSATGKELEKMMIRHALAFGYPKDGELVTTENGEVIQNYGENLPSGRYRLKIYVPTNDGVAEAYIYCQI